jgi:hypothetical protein
MGGPLYRLLISSRSINIHGHHMRFLFLICRFLKISETAWPNDTKHLWNVLYKDYSFRSYPITNMAVIAKSCSEIFRNRQIRNKNRLWWPCMLMDRDEMSNRYRGPPINAK